MTSGTKLGLCVQSVHNGIREEVNSSFWSLNWSIVNASSFLYKKVYEISFSSQCGWDINPIKTFLTVAVQSAVTRCVPLCPLSSVTLFILSTLK